MDRKNKGIDRYGFSPAVRVCVCMRACVCVYEVLKMGVSQLIFDGWIGTIKLTALLRL